MNFTRIVASLILMFRFSAVLSEDIDSLKSALDRVHDVRRPVMLLDLAFEYASSGDYVSALECAREGQLSAITYYDTLSIVRGGRIMGQVLARMDKPRESIGAFTIALNMLEPFKEKGRLAKEHGYILSGMANTFALMADYSSALKYQFGVLDLVEKRGDLPAKGNCLHNIGFIYYKLKNYKKALGYFNQAIEIQKTHMYPELWNISRINLGLTHAHLGDFVSARNTIDSLLSDCGETCGNHILKQIYFGLGVISFKMDELQNAEKHFLRSYAIRSKDHNLRLQFDNIDYLTQIYLRQNDIPKARQVLANAEKLISPGMSFNLELIKIYSRFYQFYDKVKDYRLASFYKEKYIHLKDSIYNEDFTSSLMRIEAEQFERENLAKISDQGKMLALKEEIIEKKTVINFFMLAVAALLVSFTIMLKRSNQQKKNYQ